MNVVKRLSRSLSTVGKDAAEVRGALEEAVVAPTLERKAGALPVIEPTYAELTAHEVLLKIIDRSSKGRTLWRNPTP